MRLILRIALCCSLAAALGVAQRRGGGGFSGGFHGGGSVSRGAIGGGVYRGSVGGGVYRGGYGGYRGYGGYGGYYGRYGYGFGLGLGFSYWPWYGGYGGYGGYYGGYYGAYPAYSSYPVYDSYPAAYSSYPSYQSSPNVTVVYPPQAPAQPANTVVVERSVTREYDEFGQQINRPAAPANSGPSIYLIALKDHTIHAAEAYWTDRGLLHYVGLDHVEKLVPLNTVDRDLSAQLNRERRVAFSLPASQ